MRSQYVVMAVLGLCLSWPSPPALAAAPGVQLPAFLPQIAIPFGPATDRVGPGAGLEVAAWRPMSGGDLQVTGSLAYVGFHRTTELEPTPLYALEPGGPEEASSTSRLGTQSLQVKVGAWMPVGPGYFAWAEIGDLYTRIHTRTELDVDGRTRLVGDPVHGDHGLLLTVAGGLDMGTGMVGVRLSYSPAARGLHAQRHLAWVSLFGTL